MAQHNSTDDWDAVARVCQSYGGSASTIWYFIFPRTNSVLLPKSKTAKHQESTGKFHSHPVHIWNFWASRRKKALKGPSNPPVVSFTRVFRGLWRWVHQWDQVVCSYHFMSSTFGYPTCTTKIQHSYVFSLPFILNTSKNGRSKNEVGAFQMNLWHRQRSDPCEGCRF